MFDFVREFLVWISKVTEISFEQVRVLFSKLLFCCRYFHLQMSCQSIYIFCNTLVRLIFQNIIVWKDTCLPHNIFCQVPDKRLGVFTIAWNVCLLRNMQERKIDSVFVFRNSSSSQNSFFFENINLYHIPSANRCETKKILN